MKRIVDEEIRLVPYYPNEEVALKWYQDPQLCKQVDNIDCVYTLDKLRAMYRYLSTMETAIILNIGDASLEMLP